MTLIIKYTSDKGVTDLRIVHDEQKKFENILLDNVIAMKDPEMKRTMELFAVDEITKRRSLIIPDNTSLKFGVSSDELGIQIADVLSGTLMRIWSELISGNIGKGSMYIKALRDILIPLESMHPALGINFVVSNYDLNSFSLTLANGSL